MSRLHLSLLVAILATLGGAATPATAAPPMSAPDGLHAAAAPGTTTATSAAARRGDPRLGEQWPLAAGAALGAPSAWKRTTGGDAIVAVVDSGIDLTHPDLAPNLWTNPGEVPGNGVDDDGDGFVDDVHGADFVDGDGEPGDANGHGTHVAGTIAARGGNGIGVAGVAWRAQLMAVRVLDAQAAGTTAGVAAGIRYAVAHGARIVNLSLAGPASTPDLDAAIGEAAAAGVLIVAAAGNDARDLATGPSFPASLPDDNVLGVAAVGRSGALAHVSDWGPGVDVAAPGEDIVSTGMGSGYELRTGTSMAAAHVTGTLVLLAAARPALGWRELRDALLGGARRTTAGGALGAGIVDAAGALRRVLPAARWRVATRR